MSTVLLLVGTEKGVLRQAMAMDDLDTPGVYFGMNCGQLYYSNNTGDSWNAIPCSLPRIKSVNVAAVD